MQIDGSSLEYCCSSPLYCATTYVTMFIFHFLLHLIVLYSCMALMVCEGWILTAT